MIPLRMHKTEQTADTKVLSSVFSISYQIQ